MWQLEVATGAQAAVTSLPLDVGAFALSPDGTRLVVALDVFVDCPTLECTKQRLDEQEKSKASGRLYDRLFVRHWDTWKDGRRSHLFVVPVAGGTPVDVTKGLDGDAPSKPFGGADEFTFTPGGTGVVFTMRVAGREEPWSTNFDLYLAPADGSAAPRNLTAGNKAWDVGPSFSPDGRTLAYKAMARPGYEADRYRIVLRGWPDGPERVLTEPWDRSPNELVWSKDGRTLYTTADNLGQKSLFAIDVASGDVVKTITTGKGAHGVTVSDDGAHVFVTNILDGTVSEISVATQSVVRTHEVGKGPNGITFQAQ